MTVRAGDPIVMPNADAVRKATWITKLADLPKTGKSQIVVAAMDTGALHFRIFHGKGKVMDIDEATIYDPSKPRANPPAPEGGLLRRLRMDLAKLWLGRDKLRDVEAVRIADILQFLGSPLGNELTIRADGGPGGEGQAGQAGAHGGNGGPGAAARGRSDSDAADILTPWVWCPPTNGGPGGVGGNGGKGGKGGRGGDGGTITVYTLKARMARVTTTVNAGQRGQPGKGGEGGNKGLGGKGGEGEKNEIVLNTMVIDMGGFPIPRPHDENYRLLKAGGRPGADGSDGFTNLPGDEADPARAGISTVQFGPTPPRGMSVPATASYLHMLFERFRAAYMVTDPIADRRNAAGLNRKFDWLLRTRDLIPMNEVEKPVLDALRDPILAASKSLEFGLDAFGNAPRWAPLLSYDTFITEAERALASLKAVEETATKYFDALQTSQGAAANLNLALDNSDAVKDDLDTELNDLTKTDGDIAKARAELDQLEKTRKATANSLQPVMDNFTKEVREAFGLSVNTLFNCMSQLAFTDESNPVKAGLMIGSQVGTMVHEGVNNVLTDDGEQVKKSYLLNQIKVLKEGSLKEQLTEMEGGFTDDRNSYTMLAKYAQFRELVENFRTSIGQAQVVASRLDSYIDLLQRRNRKVDAYNSLLSRLLELRGQRKTIEQRKLEIQGKLADQQAPGLPEMTSFVAGLQEQVKRDCLEELYLAYRAYAFWCSNRSTGSRRRSRRAPAPRSRRSSRRPRSAWTRNC